LAGFLGLFHAPFVFGGELLGGGLLARKADRAGARMQFADGSGNDDAKAVWLRTSRAAFQPDFLDV
jgi:hypothetical protein